MSTQDHSIHDIHGVALSFQLVEFNKKENGNYTLRRALNFPHGVFLETLHFDSGNKQLAGSSAFIPGMNWIEDAKQFFSLPGAMAGPF